MDVQPSPTVVGQGKAPIGARLQTRDTEFLKRARQVLDGLHGDPGTACAQATFLSTELTMSRNDFMSSEVSCVLREVEPVLASAFDGIGATP